MRFRNGFWHLDEGITLYSEKNYFEIESNSNKLSAYSCAFPIVTRNDTLNNPVITTDITALGENILRVDVYHHKGTLQQKPFPELSPPVTANMTETSISTGKLTAELKDNELVFSYGGKEITRRFSRLSGCMTTPNGRYMAEYLTSDIGETYYGLGERFTAFPKNGQRVDMWNLDSGCASEMSHKNVPFFISSKNYGVFVLSIIRNRERSCRVRTILSSRRETFILHHSW